MSNRFKDNVTQLNAVTLNEFEDDLKRTGSGLPVYNTVRDTVSDEYFTYKITDTDFEGALKIGYTFVMIPSVSSKGSTGKQLMISYGKLPQPLYWNNTNIKPGAGNDLATVNNELYLEAGKPYIVKCFDKVNFQYRFVLTEMYKDAPASQSRRGGIKVWASGSTLNISTT